MGASDQHWDCFILLKALVRDGVECLGVSDQHWDCFKGTCEGWGGAPGGVRPTLGLF